MRTLSEHDSKLRLAALGIKMPAERIAANAEEAVAAAMDLGFPVVAKLGGDGLAHKSEGGLVLLDLRGHEQVRAAAERLMSFADSEMVEAHVLIAPMVKGNRELILGYVRDPTWGPCVLIGHGGVLAEQIGTASMAPAPLEIASAHQLLKRFDRTGILGEIRGEVAANREQLAEMLVFLGTLADDPQVRAAEMNPVILVEGSPVPVDALVELDDGVNAVQDVTDRFQPTDAHWEALLNPRGVVIAGVSDHPGKFGSVAFHNVLAGGYAGRVFPINRKGNECLGRETLQSIDAVPIGAADMMILCTPANAAPELVRAAAPRGVRAVIVCSAGFSEIGDEGAALESQLLAAAEENDVLLIGPNVQGIVSTPARLVAQIVGPSPPPGSISIVSQSGNICSSLQNFASESGMGIARAVSIGNAAQCGVVDALEFLVHDPSTRSTIAYVESFSGTPNLRSRLGALARSKPVVIIKGGRTSQGARAAMTHTGALAGDDAVFTEMMSALGLCLADNPEHAFDCASAFASLPNMRGPRLGIMTTVGGWGVLSVDALERTPLALATLSANTITQLDAVLPSRWSRNNPVDLAGGEGKDSLVCGLDVLAGSGEVDAILLVGIGIQSNQANVMESGPLAATPGLGRMIDFHHRQDLRYVQAAMRVTGELGIPVAVASELHGLLSHTPAFAELRSNAFPCFRTAPRAIAALAELWQRSKFLAE